MPVLTFVVTPGEFDRDMEHYQHPPYAELDGVLAATFAITEARVHVITRKLRSSGTMHSDLPAPGVWTGEIDFDRYPGIYELARGPMPTHGPPPHGGFEDSHFFFDPVEARYPGPWTSGVGFEMYTKVILDWLERP